MNGRRARAGLGEVVDAADRAGLAGGGDPQPVGGAAEPVGVVVTRVVIGWAVTVAYDEGGAAVGLVRGGVGELGERGLHPDAVGGVDADDPRGSDHLAGRCGVQPLDRHLLGLHPDAERGGDAGGDPAAQCRQDEHDGADLEPSPRAHGGTLVSELAGAGENGW